MVHDTLAFSTPALELTISLRNPGSFYGRMIFSLCFTISPPRRLCLVNFPIHRQTCIYFYNIYIILYTFIAPRFKYPVLVQLFYDSLEKFQWLHYIKRTHNLFHHMPIGHWSHSPCKFILICMIIWWTSIWPSCYQTLCLFSVALLAL